MIRIGAILLSAILAAPSPASEFHVIVDPGHGGSDSGATRGHIRESEIALSVAKELSRLLGEARGIKASLTRTDDSVVSLVARSNFAKRQKGDVFVSIHANSNLNARVQGAEFYFQNQLPAEEESLLLANLENQAATSAEIDDSEGHPKDRSELAVIKEDLAKTYQIFMSRELAKNLKSEWKDDKHSVHVSVKQGPFHVISQVPMPSLLIELGFLSNPREAKWLADPGTHAALAKTIYKSLASLKEKMDKHKESGHITAHAN